jgi:hypothetical protein
VPRHFVVVDWNQQLLRDNFLMPNRIVKILNAKCYGVRWPDQYTIRDNGIQTDKEIQNPVSELKITTHTPNPFAF